MRNHFEENWLLYLVGLLLFTLIWGLTTADREEKRRTNYCYERGAVPVRTDAGWRCAQLYALEPIR